MTLHSFLVGLASTAILVTASGLLIAWRRPGDLRHWLHRARRLFGRHSTLHARPHALRRDCWDDDIQDEIVPDEPLLPLPAISHPDNLSVEYWANVARHTASQAALLWKERPVLAGRVVTDTASAWDRRNAADLRAVLDRADTNGPWLERHFAPITYQARHALALPAGATA